MLKFFLAVWFAASNAAYAGENTLTAKQILQKMVKAMAVSNYHGTVVFLKNDKLEAMKYFHIVDKNREQERLVSLNSPPREIVRNSDEVKCSYKLTGDVIADSRPYERSFIVDVPENLDELDDSYGFEVVGEEYVAMLPSYVVAIQPKDNFRYIRKIWASKAQFLPMKAVVYDLSGEVLEQVVFTEMAENEAVPEAKVNESNGVAAADINKAANGKPGATMDQAVFDVTALPKGFKQIFFTRKPLHKSDQPVDHVLLSDGFASVSVYLEAKKADVLSEAPVPDSLHSVGAVNSLRQVLADAQLTVLGEVPVSTIKYIAQGVKLRNPSR